VIRVIEEFCRGCGLCVVECPHDAIWLVFGKAWIGQERCTSCSRCIEVCPQEAIYEEVRISLEEVKAFVHSLCGKANSIMSRIDGLTRKDGAS
jgi:ferredoxin